MPRIRAIKPDFFKDEDLALLPYEARLLFAGLWCYADKEGRLENRPKYLKAEIFPYDNKIDIDKLLTLLSFPKIPDRPAKCFINCYSINGRNYIEISEFLKHQKPHHTEKESLIPKFNGELTVKKPLYSGDTQDEHYPLTDNREPLTDNREQEVKENDNSKDIQELHNHYNQTFSKELKLTSLRKQKYRLRINEFTLEKCKHAIDNCKSDTWEDRYKYCEPEEHIFKSYEQTEKWINFKILKPESKPDSPTMRGIKRLESPEYQKKLMESWQTESKKKGE